MPTTDPEIELMTYEQAFAELEATVAALESNQRSLAESTALYERGQKLAVYCARLLDGAALKVSQVSGENLVDLDSEG